MEGGDRIEVHPLPYILTAQAIREEVESWPDIATSTTDQGSFFLFPRKKVQETDEELDRVSILIWEPLPLVPT